MPSTIYHLEKKIQADKTHSYYSSLSACYNDNSDFLQVSLSTLQKWDWKKDFEKDLYSLRKGKTYSNKDVQEYNKGLEQIKPEPK